MIESGSNEVDRQDSNLCNHNHIRSTTYQLTGSTIEHSENQKDIQGIWNRVMHISMTLQALMLIVIV